MHSNSKLLTGKTISAGILGVLALGLTVGTYLVNQRFGAFELRKRASETRGAQFVLHGPQTITPGKEFNVQLYIDTSTDRNYTVTSTEALIQYDPNAVLPAPIVASPAPFQPSVPDPTSYAHPTQRPSSTSPGQSSLYGVTPFPLPSLPSGTGLCPPRITMGIMCTQGGPVPDCPNGEKAIWGHANPCDACPRFICPSTQTIHPDSNLVKGATSPIPLTLIGTSYGGAFANNSTQSDGAGLVRIKGEAPRDIQRGGRILFATLTFKSSTEGQAKISVVFLGEQVTNDSNITSYLQSQPSQLQHGGTDRLLTNPSPLTITVNNTPLVATPAPAELGNCIPRPPCLNNSDPKIRCMVPERSDYCPPSGSPPVPSNLPSPRGTNTSAGCYYQQVQCIQAPCNPILVCPSPTPVSTTTTSNSSIPAAWKTDVSSGASASYSQGVFTLTSIPRKYIRINQSLSGEYEISARVAGTMTSTNVPKTDSVEFGLYSSGLPHSIRLMVRGDGFGTLKEVDLWGTVNKEKLPQSLPANITSVFLKLAKSNTTINAFYSLDGSSWKYIGQVTASDTTIETGMYVFGESTGTGTFDQVRVQSPPNSAITSQPTNTSTSQITTTPLSSPPTFYNSQSPSSQNEEFESDSSADPYSYYQSLYESYSIPETYQQTTESTGSLFNPRRTFSDIVEYQSDEVMEQFPTIVPDAPTDITSFAQLIAQMRTLWGSDDATYDLNHDGILNTRDLFLLLQTIQQQGQ